MVFHLQPWTSLFDEMARYPFTPIKGFKWPLTRDRENKYRGLLSRSGSPHSNRRHQYNVIHFQTRTCFSLSNEDHDMVHHIQIVDINKTYTLLNEDLLLHSERGLWYDSPHSNRRHQQTYTLSNSALPNKDLDIVCHIPIGDIIKQTVYCCTLPNGDIMSYSSKWWLPHSNERHKKVFLSICNTNTKFSLIKTPPPLFQS